MEHLPSELVAQICCQLCPHCPDSESFPNADTEETVVAKASLARLARVSRRMCAIAQPFVFHYYATGNLVCIYRSEQPGYSFQPAMFGKDDDHLTSFLYAVIQRPDLAKSVCALQLVTPTYSYNTPSSPYDERSTTRSQETDDLVITAIQKTSARLGLVGFVALSQQYMDWTRNRANVDPSTNFLSIKDIHYALEQLAIVLCPNASKILLLGPSSPDGNLFLLNNRALPALKTIGLLSLSTESHYAKCGPLLSLAPNLENIFAADLRVPEQPRQWTPAWGGTLPRLKKAVVQDLGLEGLRSLVRSAPELRELRYTDTTASSLSRLMDCHGFVAALEPVCKSILRLSFQFLSEKTRIYPHHGSVIESLRHFTKLEELTVNQAAIYGKTNHNERLPGGLVGLLPRSIVRLRILDDYWPLHADLADLARDAPNHLPHLKSVWISEKNDWFVYVGERLLTEHFQGTGISTCSSGSGSGERIYFPETRDIPGLPMLEGYHMTDPQYLRYWKPRVTVPA